jgi:transposase
VFEVQKSVSKIIGTLSGANIEHRGLFLNADAGLDSEKMRDFCAGLEISPNIAINKRGGGDHDHLLDDELYEGRLVVERTNAWLDAFKSLLVRYETKARNWMAQHYLVFTIIFLRRILQNGK